MKTRSLVISIFCEDFESVLGLVKLVWFSKFRLDITLAMTEIPGQEKRGIVAIYYVKRTAKDKAPKGVHTCSAKLLEPIATQGAAKSALRPENGLKMVALNADGDAQDCDNAFGGGFFQYGQF